MVNLLPSEILRSRVADGVVLESVFPLPRPARAVGVWLERWATARPRSVFLAERDGAAPGWRVLEYGEALHKVQAIGSALLAMGAEPTRPVMILSDNSIDAALLALACQHIGVPVATVSSAYSLLSKDFGRLRAVSEQLAPAFVFADDVVRYAAALEVVSEHRPRVLSSAGAEGVKTISQLTATPVSGALREAWSRVGPDTIAKILFTSGSTGTPKGVVNTQRMLTSNQESLATCWPFLHLRPPVIVDWLPWSHTFGANHNFNMVLRNGGTLYLDRGRPAPGLIDTTLKNLAEVGPTLWVNVPRGFDQAVAVLEREPELARKVFSNLDVIFHAAAALNPSTRQRLRAVAQRAGRPDVFMTAAWGATETAPLATSAHFESDAPGCLGAPIPGVRLKLARVEDHLELRVAGPNVTPGYWRRGGGIDAVKLDEDGFLPTGDAGRMADPADPNAGVCFVGRIGENFKVSAGTWVNVASVRLGVVDTCAPLVLDAVIAGHDRDFLGALLFRSPAAQGISEAELRARVIALLTRYNSERPGATERIRRAVLVDAPLSLDHGETTDKGYTNQRRVLQRRADEVRRLFADAPDHGVLILDS